MNTINKHIISHLLPISILLLAVYSVIPYIKPGIPMVSLLDNTVLWWGISAFILIGFFLSRYYFFDKRNTDNMMIIWIYLLWNVMCIVRGMFVAEIYWDWKGLIGNSMALLMPIIIFSATNKMVVQSLLATYIKYALPLFLLFGLMIRTDAFGFYLIPITFLLLFLPILNKRQKTLLLGATFIVLVADLGARSSVIKFSLPLLILIIYYFRNIIPVKTIETLRLSLFIIPILFLVLGVSGVFNVFKMNEYIKGEYTSMGVDGEGNIVEQDIIVDTRTFLYVEVLESAVNNNYWLLGRTPARGNDSDTFGVLAAELTGRYERIENEIGLANVFTWTGIVGVILYFLIFYRATFLAINKSRNIYVKMLGVYVAFRWLFSWIEDVNNFSLNYFMLMIMLGLCFSYSFRNMTDNEIIIWARGIFDVRYVRLQQILFKKEINEKRKYGGLVDLPQQEK
jgi:hypothetical protein